MVTFLASSCPGGRHCLRANHAGFRCSLMATPFIGAAEAALLASMEAPEPVEVGAGNLQCTTAF